jgi:hypothetical protein
MKPIAIDDIKVMNLGLGRSIYSPAQLEEFARSLCVRLLAFGGGNCFTAGGFPSNPIPVRVCAEH